MKDEDDVISVAAKEVEIGDEIFIHVSNYAGWEKVTGVVVTSNGQVKITTIDSAYYPQDRLFRVKKGGPASRVRAPLTVEELVQRASGTCSEDTVHQLAEALHREISSGAMTVDVLEGHLVHLMLGAMSKVA